MHTQFIVQLLFLIEYDCKSTKCSIFVGAYFCNNNMFLALCFRQKCKVCYEKIWVNRFSDVDGFGV